MKVFKNLFFKFQNLWIIVFTCPWTPLKFQFNIDLQFWNLQWSFVMCIGGTDPWQYNNWVISFLGERVEPFVHSNDTRSDQHFKNPRKKPFGHHHHHHNHHHHHWQGMLTELVALRSVWEKNTKKICDQNWAPRKCADQVHL